MPPAVRRATEADIPRLLQTTDLFDRPPSKTGLQALTSSPNHILLLAELDQEISAFCTLHLLPAPDQDTKEAFIFEIGTVEHHQRKGVATVLLRQATEVCQKENHRGPWIITNKSNEAAVRLYQSIGWIAQADDDIVFENPNTPTH